MIVQGGVSLQHLVCWSDPVCDLIEAMDPGPWKDMNWRSPKRCGKCHHSSVLGEEVLELSRARVKGVPYPVPLPYTINRCTPSKLGIDYCVMQEPPGVIVSNKKLQLIQDEKDNHLFDDIPESPGDMAPEEMERLCEAAEGEHDITSPNGPRARETMSDEEEEMT